ncbi:MAG: hypothetical protein KAU20_05545 [Nanoarchaeota archaeon]|nr:hypothetical protein [Nanoarchaeota archaeon]
MTYFSEVKYISTKDMMESEYSAQELTERVKEELIQSVLNAMRPSIEVDVSDWFDEGSDGRRSLMGKQVSARINLPPVVMGEATVERL